ncbi:hypothetical protein DTO027I6_9992 [Penicillium roqueforti]|nr:hypothetical protein CBS147337_10143 [Penicillium roqueforti]KAI3184250.1 hypothetical protein DTO027I6_9992 [Penicillium roqueforti]
MNSGVFEPLAVRIARSYPITTVQFIITDGFVTRLCLSEVARCTQRGFFEATAGDRDDLDTTCQHGMNGDHIDQDYSNFCDLYELEVPSWSRHSSRIEARKCIVCSDSPIPMRFHALSPDMTIGGIDDEPM